MGYVLAAVGYIAGYMAILFQTICIACGLYYAAELAEEYASATKRMIMWSISAVVGVHVLLYFESFPLLVLLGGIACHGAYAWLLMDFPKVEIFSYKFLLGLVALCADHYIWFQYLHGRPSIVPSALTSIAIFFLLVWFVPFAIFVSLSVNDNVLPSMTSSPQYSSSSSDAMYYSDYSSTRSLSMSDSGSYSKGTSRNTSKKGGIRGMLDTLNAHIAPGIAKNV
ncbi:Transmembrane adaptor Erv26 [Nannochloropsis gaditana]|uniref:Transmembrane adaptor Erv26 n=1 Tax=Nannochloropsis gaditana TaxID=72520 RepID=W7TSM9_9STRA|nr:Transmembrane adaptor Erv26 [Nannochloropsis gaditana]